MSESTHRPDAAFARALSLSRSALAESPAGLLTDFDGTLSPVVGDPSRARLVEGAADALAALARRLAVVAVVTGRAATDARHMTGVRGLLIAGNHGTEWLEPDADDPDASPQAAAVRERLERVLERVPELEGVIVEDKVISATVHYRNAGDPDGARRAILDALGDVSSEGLERRPGRMSVEIRAPELGDKGSAVRAIIERFGLRGAVVMGDDITDLDMFRAVGELRADGRIDGVIIGVEGAGGEAPPEVAAAADVMLAGPPDAARLLAALTES